MKSTLEDKHIVFFDGVCGLCDRFVRLIILFDREEIFLFAPLQGELAEEVADNLKSMETMVYYQQGQYFYRSDAALKILAQLSFPWNLFKIFLILPRFLRDSIYKLIAKTRYKIFGKFDTYTIRHEDFTARFLS